MSKGIPFPGECIQSPGNPGRFITGPAKAGQSHQEVVDEESDND